jgi:hypothetical protein
LKAFFENIVFNHQKQIACIGIYLISRDEWKFSIINVRNKKNEISIVSSIVNLKELKKDAEIIPADIPVLIHIDGWGVLIKESGTENNSIPLDNPEFFVKEYPKAEGKGSYFSIIRTDLLKRIMDYINSVSIPIAGLSFGPFHTGLIAPFLENGEEIKSGKWQLALKNGHIVKLESTGIEPNVQYDIGGDKVTSDLLPLYTSLISFFSGERDNNPFIVRYKDEFVYGRLTKYIGLGALFFILFLLLINYFIWDNLRNRNSELMLEIARNEQFLSRLTDVKKELKEKENLVFQYIGTTEKTHYSWYADRLALILPHGIRLTLLDIQPVSKKTKPGIAIIYKNRQINVEGDTRNLSEIGDWVKAIGSEIWVRKVELISYSKENEQGLGHFKLQIDY